MYAIQPLNLVSSLLAAILRKHSMLPIAHSGSDASPACKSTIQLEQDFVDPPTIYAAGFTMPEMDAQPVQAPKSVTIGLTSAGQPLADMHCGESRSVNKLDLYCDKHVLAHRAAGSNTDEAQEAKELEAIQLVNWVARFVAGH